jgi:hypothetical protein
LPRDPAKGCAPVFPWNFVRTNTIFGVVHSAGGYTAWSDKHPSYSSVSGPGNGINLDDYYSPEVNSLVVSLPGVHTPSGMPCAPIADPSQTGSWTDSFQNIQCYDTLKVNAVMNWIDGKNHLGTKTTQVPTIFGMNFQAVSVGQKLIESGVKGGYTDAAGTPTFTMEGEIKFVDGAVGELELATHPRGRHARLLVVPAVGLGRPARRLRVHEPELDGLVAFLPGGAALHDDTWPRLDHGDRGHRAVLEEDLGHPQLSADHSVDHRRLTAPARRP